MTGLGHSSREGGQCVEVLDAPADSSSREGVEEAGGFEGLGRGDHAGGSLVAHEAASDPIHLPALTGDRRSLNATVGLLGSELDRPLPGSAAVVPALLDAMLLYILRAWIDEQAGQHPVTGWAAALSDPAILAALSVIHDDPARPWTVQALAQHAALSRAAFARRFTATVGQAPIAYLTWWRMTMAARSLRETDAPIAAVAKEIGYTSQFAFANAFKRAFGTAPGRYRRVRPTGCS
jgi:AraC-like DNA-binding protein